MKSQCTAAVWSSRMAGEVSVKVVVVSLVAVTLTGCSVNVLIFTTYILYQICHL